MPPGLWDQKSPRRWSSSTFRGTEMSMAHDPKLYLLYSRVIVFVRHAQHVLTNVASMQFVEVCVKVHSWRSSSSLYWHFLHFLIQREKLEKRYHTLDIVFHIQKITQLFRYSHRVDVEKIENCKESLSSEDFARIIRVDIVRLSRILARYRLRFVDWCLLKGRFIVFW